MENKKPSKKKIIGSSKTKATFDQNGKGKSDKFGQAGTTPNESGADIRENQEKKK